MNIHTKTKYSILSIIPLILSILLPAVSLADANRIYKENNNAVVVITAYDERGNAISQGSGFIVRSDGAVVTNYHVISKARDIKVKAGDKILDVEGLIFTDKKNDLVVLKVKANNMPVVKFGIIERENIGENVYVISSPEGFENTISDGLLSGIRKIDEEREILQITAPVSPGSSGGAVFNRNGEVIGVVTMLIEEAQNLNFAMPVKLIKDKISSKSVTAIEGSGLEDYEKTAEYWVALGYCYSESAMYKEAIEALKQAIRINPDWAAVYTGLGFAYSQLGMNREAIEAFKQAIRLNPDRAQNHYNLGYVYFQLALQPLTPSNAGNVYVSRDAREYHHDRNCNNLRTTDHLMEFFSPQAAKNAGGIPCGYCDLSGLGMYNKAINEFKQAIRLNSGYAKAHNLLGLAYISTNAKASALEQYRILKNLNPKMANALYNLVYK